MRPSSTSVRDGLEGEVQQHALAPGLLGDRGAASEVRERRPELSERAARAAVHPERGQAGRQLRRGKPVKRGGGLVQPACRLGPVGRRRARQGADGEGGELEDGIVDRAGVVAGVAGVGLRGVEVAGDQRGQAEREPEADPVRRRLRRLLAEGDVQAAAGVLMAAEPPFLVGQRDREPQAVSRSGGRERAQQRFARGLRVSGGRLGIGAQPLQPSPALALGVGQQPQRGGVIARRGGGGRGLQLDRGGAEQRDRVLVAGAGGVLDVVGALHRAGAAALQFGGRAGVSAEPPAAGRRDVHRVPHHGVAEREAARRSRRPHERLDEQLVQGLQRPGLGQLGDRSGQAGLEGIAGHRGRVEKPARAGRQRSELHGQRGRDARRYRAVLLADSEARHKWDAGELLEVERVAAGRG